MTSTTALIVVVVVWLAIGAISAIVMARRGHDPSGWAALGALWGPLVVPIMLATRRDDRELAAWSRIERPGKPGGGPIHVLVGIDGSLDAQAAAVTAGELLGDRLGQMTLAAVIDHDTAGTMSRDGAASTEPADRALEDAAEGLGADMQPKTVMLTGRPADALIMYARENDVDLIAVGARGHGMSRAFVGHVTERLVRQRDVPVLVAGCPEQVGSR